jgi:general secretion pathway protein J
MTGSSQRGLTLPELLVALLIFAMISGAAVYALRLSVEGHEQLENADSSIRDLQVARLLMKEDMALIAPRVVRDEFGNAYPAAFLGGRGLGVRPTKEGERLLMAFVRRGWNNPEDRNPRSTLQAVEYLVVGESLVRRTRPYLDDARDQPRTDRVLINDVRDAAFGFYAGEVGGRMTWADLWPAPGLSGSPTGVRLTMTTERLGDLEQIFWIGEVGK